MSPRSFILRLSIVGSNIGQREGDKKVLGLFWNNPPPLPSVHLGLKMSLFGRLFEAENRHILKFLEYERHPPSY